MKFLLGLLLGLLYNRLKLLLLVLVIPSTLWAGRRPRRWTRILRPGRLILLRKLIHLGLLLLRKLLGVLLSILHRIKLRVRLRKRLLLRRRRSSEIPAPRRLWLLDRRLILRILTGSGLLLMLRLLIPGWRIVALLRICPSASHGGGVVPMLLLRVLVLAIGRYEHGLDLTDQLLARLEERRHGVIDSAQRAGCGNEPG